MSAIAIRQGSPEWLEARRHTIGSSDIPIIAGESTWKSPYTLAAEKLGLVEPVVDADTQQLMEIGKLLEPALLGIHDLVTGRHATSEHRRMHVHPQIAWATASLDGRAPEKVGRRVRWHVVEAKWSNADKWRRGERIPGDVQAQVQWQLFVTGWDIADVVALDHGVPRVEPVERDEAFIDNLLFLARRFHADLEARRLPEPDGSDSTSQTVRRQAPRDNGLVVVPTPETRELAVRYRAAKEATKAAADEEASIGNALRLLIGEAAEIAGLVSYRRNADSVRVNWPAVAKAHRETALALGADPGALDAIESMHSETVEGPRVLRLLKGTKE